MEGQDSYDNRWKFYYERLRFLWWQVEKFIVTSVDFYYDRSRFSWWEVNILLWLLNIFLMTSRDFQDDKLKLSWWLVEILLWVAKILMMNGWGFCDNRSSFYDGRSRFFNSYFGIKLTHGKKAPGSYPLVKKLFKTSFQNTKKYGSRM